ncbi:MAG: bifunctional heptose 7-phosphate kinase/heptose 1-phosphate adenyltransferase [Gemmatimonadota bacterium]
MNRLEHHRARQLLSRASGKEILVVGDLMLDRYITGSVDRISPEAPVPVIRVEGESLAVGGAGNVAANAVALGASCQVVGCVGDDVEGILLRERLEELGVATGGVVTLPGRPTTVKTRIMARHQHVTRVDREDTSDIPPELAQELLAIIRSALPSAEGLVLEDYNKGVLVPAVIRGALERSREMGIPSVVDPKRMRFFEYEGATVFKPNARELEDALGEPLQTDDPAWLESIRRRLGTDTLLLTLGERGMALQCREGGFLRVPTVARDVYDVSGAGDTVTAVMAVGLAAGATPMEAAIMANHAAAVEVGKAGVATVSPEEILSQQQDHT